MQLVGNRYDIVETDLWGTEIPKSGIVLIGEKDSFDVGLIKEQFDLSIGTDEDANSPMLRVMRKIAPHLLEV